MAALIEVDMDKIICFGRNLIAVFLVVSFMAAGCDAKAEAIPTPTVKTISTPTVKTISTPTIAPPKIAFSPTPLGT